MGIVAGVFRGWAGVDRFARAVYVAVRPQKAAVTGVPERLRRHGLTERLLHWLMAVSVLILLGTAFVPVMGLKFSWVAPHWIAGLLLSAALSVHIAASLRWSKLRLMWVGIRDLADAWQLGRWALAPRTRTAPIPGKYSLAQKLYHHAIAVIVLIAVATGLVMLLRIDSPLWERDPYWLAESTWGVIYVLHGLAALCCVTLIMLHVYFALRPEKLFYTRSMFSGTISRTDYLANHDPARWQADV